MVAYETDEKLKEKKFEPLLKETVPYLLDKLDAVAKANKGHLACGEVSNFSVNNVFYFKFYRILTKSNNLV